MMEVITESRGPRQVPQLLHRLFKLLAALCDHEINLSSNTNKDSHILIEDIPLITQLQEVLKLVNGLLGSSVLFERRDIDASLRLLSRVFETLCKIARTCVGQQLILYTEHHGKVPDKPAPAVRLPTFVNNIFKWLNDERERLDLRRTLRVLKVLNRMADLFNFLTLNPASSSSGSIAFSNYTASLLVPSDKRKAALKALVGESEEFVVEEEHHINGFEDLRKAFHCSFVEGASGLAEYRQGADLVAVVKLKLEHVLKFLDMPYDEKKRKEPEKNLELPFPRQLDARVPKEGLPSKEPEGSKSEPKQQLVTVISTNSLRDTVRAYILGVEEKKKKPESNSEKTKAIELTYKRLIKDRRYDLLLAHQFGVTGPSRRRTIRNYAESAEVINADFNAFEVQPRLTLRRDSRLPSTSLDLVPTLFAGSNGLADAPGKILAKQTFSYYKLNPHPPRSFAQRLSNHTKKTDEVVMRKAYLTPVYYVHKPGSQAAPPPPQPMAFTKQQQQQPIQAPPVQIPTQPALPVGGALPVGKAPLLGSRAPSMHVDDFSGQRPGKINEPSPLGSNLMILNPLQQRMDIEDKQQAASLPRLVPTFDAQKKPEEDYSQKIPILSFQPQETNYGQNFGQMPILTGQMAPAPGPTPILYPLAPKQMQGPPFQQGGLAPGGVLPSLTPFDDRNSLPQLNPLAQSPVSNQTRVDTAKIGSLLNDMLTNYNPKTSAPAHPPPTLTEPIQGASTLPPLFSTLYRSVLAPMSFSSLFLSRSYLYYRH
eukprot:TRINITY_DN2155_c0_g1_i8.p1 TRINITY_DN2155_c0_g1~~TRINITY_DN2155_c0_g1_i8.p1  ORF type:complete len:765 (-),score=204.03 TRINITY_DN2155_c0_g1_i8:15-2309(-)